jgi:rare lipoprotein A
MLTVVLCCQPSKRFTGNANSDPGAGSDIDIENTETVVGYATYYGPGFHGKKTASGEIFDMYKMTCAHRTLPFGTMLLITNLSNNKSVKVRVNDRGPFIEGRIIDLSFGAAQRIGLEGKTLVRIEILNQ